MIEVVAPKLGMQSLDADVTEISVAVGQPVRPGDVLLTLESEKVEIEIESEWEGTVESILVRVGEVINPGDVLLRLQTTAPEQS